MANYQLSTVYPYNNLFAIKGLEPDINVDGDDYDCTVACLDIKNGVSAFRNTVWYGGTVNVNDGKLVESSSARERIEV